MGLPNASQKNLAIPELHAQDVRSEQRLGSSYVLCIALNRGR